jgi:hypothetical protein
MPSPGDLPAVNESLGSSVSSYLHREARGPARELLEEQASSFRIGDQPAEFEVRDGPALDLGGSHSNHWAGAAMVPEDARDAIAAAVNGETPEGFGPAFLTHRFLDVDLSQDVGRPVIGISSGVIAAAYVPSAENPQKASVSTLDRQGAREILAEGLDRLQEAAADSAAQLNKMIPPRDDRLEGHLDRLVGYSGRDKVYVSFAVEDQWQDADREFGGFRTVDYRAVTPLDVTDGDPSINDARNPWFSVPGIDRALSFEWQGYLFPGTKHRPPTGGGVEEIMGSGGYGPPGPPGISIPGFGSCTSYRDRDECKNCCLAIQLEIQAVASGAMIACALASFGLGTGICVFLGGVAMGYSIVAGAECQDNCNLATPIPLPF